MHASSTQVLIAGAGPVGLTCALVLARHGIQVRIIDEGESPSEHSKALVLWRGSLKALHPYIETSLFRTGRADVRGVQLSSEKAPIAHMSLEDEDRGVVPGIFIPQYDTESCLIEALRERGVEVERGSRLTSFSSAAEGASAQLSTTGGDEEITVPWLIGCDGGHSLIRKTLGLSFEGRSSDRRWLIADVDIDRDEDIHVLHVVRAAAGMVVCIPISEGRWRILVDAGDGDGGDSPEAPTIEEIQQIIDDRTSLGWKIRNQYWLTHFKINERQVESYVNGRVLLAGDAAHVHSPAGAQGMNTGIQDAVNLSWKLAMVLKGQAPESLMRTYDEERIPVGAAVIKASGLMTRAAMNTSPIAIGLGKVLAPIMTTLPMVRKRAMAFLTEDSVSYREGSLAGIRADHVSHGPGDLFPDFMIQMEGDSRPAVDLLMDPGFTLIVIGDSKEPTALVECFLNSGVDLNVRQVGPAGQAQDNGGRLVDAFNLPSSGFILVRPDSVIAAVSEEVGPLVSWFKGVTSGQAFKAI